MVHPLVLDRFSVTLPVSSLHPGVWSLAFDLRLYPQKLCSVNFAHLLSQRDLKRGSAVQARSVEGAGSHEGCLELSTSVVGHDISHHDISHHDISWAQWARQA